MPLPRRKRKRKWWKSCDKKITKRKRKKVRMGEGSVKKRGDGGGRYKAVQRSKGRERSGSGDTGGGGEGGIRM